MPFARLLALGLFCMTVRAEAGCYQPAKGTVVVQEGTAFGNEGGVWFVTTMTGAPMPQMKPSAGLIIYDQQCRLLHRQSFDEAGGVLLDRIKLGSTEWLHATVRFPGGSGSSFLHLLFMRNWNGAVVALAPTALEHTNMGGFHIGALGDGRGPGIAIWDADWDEGAHYAPHPYVLTLFRWVGNAFSGPEVLRSQGKLNPDLPNDVPAAFGLSFENDTHPERFEQVGKNLSGEPRSILPKTPTRAQ